MSSDPLEERILASFQAKRMEQKQSYLLRGRHFEKEDDATLLVVWKRNFAAYVTAVGNPETQQHADDARRQYEDAEAELELRSLEPPYKDEDVKSLINMLQKKAEAAFSAASPEVLADRNQDILNDIDRLLGKSEIKN